MGVQGSTVWTHELYVVFKKVSNWQEREKYKRGTQIQKKRDSCEDRAVEEVEAKSKSNTSWYKGNNNVSENHDNHMHMSIFIYVLPLPRLLV